MLTEEQRKRINDFNLNKEIEEKLISYLSMHTMVGPEVFLLCDEDKKIRLKWIPFSPVNVECFINRIPFYFYEGKYGVSWDFLRMMESSIIELHQNIRIEVLSRQFRRSAL